MLPGAWSSLKGSGGTVVLSPHPDDAAFSLGGALFAGLLPPPVTIVTVFDRSDFCGRGSRGDLELVTAKRAREDERFCASVGARLMRFGLADACVRYPTLPIAALFEAEHSEPVLAGELAARLDRLAEMYPGANLLAPMAAGGHIDHVLVAAAAWASRWTSRFFYADQPYALRLGMKPVETVMQVPPSLEAMWAKVRAAVAYSSQPAAQELALMLERASTEEAVEWVSEASENLDRDAFHHVPTRLDVATC